VHGFGEQGDRMGEIAPNALDYRERTENHQGNRQPALAGVVAVGIGPMVVVTVIMAMAAVTVVVVMMVMMVRMDRAHAGRMPLMGCGAKRSASPFTVLPALALCVVAVRGHQESDTAF
jgi:hypothetical protein